VAETWPAAAPACDALLAWAGGFNVDFIERNGVGCLIAEEALPTQIEAWLSDPAALAAMQATALRLGRRNGAADIAQRALGLADRARGEVTRSAN